MTAKTCAPCRSRKIKCDGISPICGPCTRSKRILICGYPPGSLSAKADIKEVLPKGAACFPCRRKKKKCDAKRPYCDTCKAGGREYECNYEGDDGYSHIQALLKRNRELEEALCQYEERQSGRLPRSALDLETPTWPSGTGSSSGPLRFGLKNTRRPNMVNLDGCFWDLLGSSGSNAPPTIVVPPAAMLLKSPRPDIDLTFRAIFLADRYRFGFWLPPLKLQAIFMGDLSNAIVHPGLVHLAHMWGCSLLQEHEEPFIFADLEHSYLMSAISSVDEGNCDPIVLVQVYTLLLMYFFYKHAWASGYEYAAKAAAVVKDFGLRMSPPRDNQDDFTFLQARNPMFGEWEACDAVQEQTSALAQLLFTEIAYYLLIHKPLSPSCAELENQLRDDLHVIYPNLCKTNLNVLRTRTLLFTKDAYRLIAVLKSHFTPGWLESYWELLIQLKQHICVVDSFLAKSSYSSERGIAMAVKYCSMFCHATEAELHLQLAACGHAESKHQCRQNLSQIANAVKGLSDLDHFCMDPLLAVCWSSAIGALKQLQALGNSLLPEDPTYSSQALTTTDPELQHYILVLDEVMKKLKDRFPFVSRHARAGDFWTDPNQLLALPSTRHFLC